MDDPSSNSQKAWVFDTSMTGEWWNGLLSQYNELEAWTKNLTYRTFTWTTDANGTPYISSRKMTLDYGTTDAKTTRAEQTLDIHGNVLTSTVYDYGAGNTPGPL